MNIRLVPRKLETLTKPLPRRPSNALCTSQLPPKAPQATLARSLAAPSLPDKTTQTHRTNTAPDTILFRPHPRACPKGSHVPLASSQARRTYRPRRAPSPKSNPLAHLPFPHQTPSLLQQRCQRHQNPPVAPLIALPIPASPRCLLPCGGSGSAASSAPRGLRLARFQKPSGRFSLFPARFSRTAEGRR